MVEIHRNLEENAYNVELAVDAVLTEYARQAGNVQGNYFGWGRGSNGPFNFKTRGCTIP